MARTKAQIDIVANDKTQRAIKSAKRGLGEVQRAASNMSRVVGGLGIAAGGLGLAAFAKDTLQVADNIAKTADRVGLTTDALQELRYAAELTGVAQNALDMGMQRFSRRAAEAAKGSGVLKDEFKALGISLHDNEGNLKSNEDLLYEYADAIKNAESEQEALRLAFKAFDSEGAAMVNTLRDGSQGLETLRRRAKEAGAVLDEDLLRSAEEINDEFTEMSATLTTSLQTAFLSAAKGAQTFGRVLASVISGESVSALKRNERSLEIIRAQIKVAELRYKRGNFEGRTEEQAFERLQALRQKETVLLQKQADGGLNLAEAESAQRQAVEEYIAAEERKQALLEQGDKKDKDRKSKDCTKRKTEDTDALTEAKRREAEATRLATEAQQAFNDIMERGADLTRDMRTPVEEYHDLLFDLDELLQENAIDHETYYRALKKYQDDLAQTTESTTEVIEKQTDKIAEAANEFGNVFNSALEDAIINGASFSDVLKGLEQDIIRIITRILVTDPLQGAITDIFKGASTGGTNPFSGIFSSIGGFFTGLFKAEGGAVSANQAYVVGEKGPELFMPSVSGAIIPNNQMAAAGGITINMNVSTPDANSFRMSEGQIGASAAMAISRAQRNL